MEKIKTSGLTRMISIAGAVIFFASLEALINAKSIEAYKAYHELIPQSSFSDFIAYILQNYLSIILEPIIITLYTVFTINKVKINKYYRFVFSSILFIRLLFIVFELNYQSVFYYIIIVLYVLLLKIVLTIKN